MFLTKVRESETLAVSERKVSTFPPVAAFWAGRKVPDYISSR